MNKTAYFIMNGKNEFFSEANGTDFVPFFADASFYYSSEDAFGAINYYSEIGIMKDANPRVYKIDINGATRVDA